jgi:hypothetical protein
LLPAGHALVSDTDQCRAPGALTALDAVAACGAVFEPLMAELFWPAAVALGPMSEGSAGVK